MMSRAGWAVWSAWTAALWLALAAGCGWVDVAMGGGGDATETGNARVAGNLVMENGEAASGAEVVILPEDFSPVGGDSIPDSLRVKTDASGKFAYAKLDSGRYTLSVHHGQSGKRLLISGIHLGSGKTQILLPKDTLHNSCKLVVPIPESPDSGLGFVYIPGTSIRGRVDSETRAAGKIVLDSVPPGILPSVSYCNGDGSARVVLDSNVKATKAATVFVPPYRNWSHARTLVLNTSATGVEISKPQFAFPLLVRLSSPAFDFSQAKADGSDLRFAKSDGAPMPWEIETWDPAAGHAEVWVRVDTVRAGEATQSISMHWGNASAAKPKHGRPVFDTSFGIAAAWHLGEEAADTTKDGLYRDATGAGNNGNDRLRNTSVTGVIAGGHGFDSADFIFSPKSTSGLQNPNAFNLSAWYRSNGQGLGVKGGEILSVGDNYGLRIIPDGTLRLFYWPPTPPAGQTVGWWQVEYKSSVNLDGNWHCVSGSYDGSQLRLYVDGKPVGNQAVTGPVGFLYSVSVTMGKHGNGKQGYEFVGSLDEPQIHSVARDADWVKLTYENQKPGGGFPAQGP